MIGERYTAENAVYTPEPMLISLPSLTEKDEWLYDAEVSCKFDSETILTFVERKVQKVWKDDGEEDKTPEADLRATFGKWNGCGYCALEQGK